MMFEKVLDTPLSVIVLLIVLAALELYFLARFVVPAVALLIRLNAAVRGLNKICRSADGNAHLDALFSKDRYLALSWDRYKKTLSGATVEKRDLSNTATVPASLYFDRHDNVNVPLALDFFRHCPGIMTGIGIFGTFLGLLLGLHRFADTVAGKQNALAEVHSVAGNPAVASQVRDNAFVAFDSGASTSAAEQPTLKVLDDTTGSGLAAHHVSGSTIAHGMTTLPSVMDAHTVITALARLLHSVSDAFIVSALAILVALFTTLIEKLLVAHCYRRLHEVSLSIDMLMAFSPHDEGMARLIRAMEITATQTRQITLVVQDAFMSRDRI